MLIALALNNPNEEEARSAAIKAVSLIVQQNMSIEGNSAGQGIDPSKIRKAWKPDDEFEGFWDQVVNAASQTYKTQEDVDRSAWEQQSPAPDGGGLKTAFVDTDVEDAFSAMRNRIKVAWRAIQRERAKLKTEIYRWEQEHYKRYPRQEPKDWEDGES
jgi:hypothetical protein